MHEKKSRISQPKSFSSFHDLFGFWRPLYYVSKNRGNTNKLTIGPNCKECEKVNPNKLGLVTVEQIQALNRGPSVCPVARSTSTIFYDLDILAKRHSFHCLTEDKKSNTSFAKSLYLPNHTHSDKHDRHGYKKTSRVDAEIRQSKVVSRDSVEFNSKKITKIQSSEILLKDIQMGGFKSAEFEAYKLVHGQHQKYWSSSKCEDKNNESTLDENQDSAKDSSTIDDPCPCELFSYTCPCHKVSVTNIRRSDITRPTVNHITSNLKLQYNLSKEIPRHSTRQSKLDEIGGEDLFDEDLNSKFTQVNKRSRSPCRKTQKSVHRLTCPKCYHKIEVYSSTDGEEDKNNDQTFAKVEISAANASIHTKCKHQIFGDEFKSFCPHEPMCATIPVCQAIQSKIWSKQSSKHIKCNHNHSMPRVIRITKACRHHPPCTVVPSCQKINVLKNNCEYIPPCFHRPRCVNIPLCVPCSKSVNYDENLQAELEEHFRSLHMAPCQHQSSNNVDSLYRDLKMPHHRDVQVVSHAHKDHVEVITPAQDTQHSTPCSQKSISPCPTPQTFAPSVSTKSCQYQPEQFDNRAQESESDAVIFIRDVGCQFKNKNCDLSSVGQSRDARFPNEIKSYFANVHTLRYEDKFTNPKQMLNSTMVLKSFSSEELHSKIEKGQTMAVTDAAQFLAAYTHVEPQTPFTCPSKNVADATPKHSLCPISITSKASSLICKFQPAVGMKKRKRSRFNNNNVITIYSRKSSHSKH